MPHMQVWNEGFKAWLYNLMAAGDEVRVEAVLEHLDACVD